MDTNSATDLYRRFLQSDPRAKHLLENIPWVLDTARQMQLERTLILESARLAEQHQTLFSLLTPCFNTDPRHIEELITSVQCQSWSNWELILVDDGSTNRSYLEVAEKLASEDPRIKLLESVQNQGISGARNQAYQAAKGDWIAIMDHDDLLHPQTLGIYARYVEQNNDASFIYSNYVKLRNDSTLVSDLFSKPDFDYATLLRVNYLAHFVAIRRDQAKTVVDQSGALFQSQFDGAEDHDLFLRLAVLDGFKPIHVPMFLYSWRKHADSTASQMAAKPHVADAAKKLVEKVSPQIEGVRPIVSPPFAFEKNRFHSIHYRIDPNTKSCLVIVPFKDQAKLTKKCFESLEQQETGLRLQVVGVDNNSNEASTQEFMDSWSKGSHSHEYTFETYKGAFNFDRINNWAAKKYGANHDLVMFLNNDVELTSPDCLDTLAGQLLVDQSLAFCGMQLLFPGSDEIQHGGIKLNPTIVGSGYYRLAHIWSDDEFVNDEHVAMGVTFAACMCRQQVLQDLGYLDEDFFATGLGDVDACLRANEKGYRNFYYGTLLGVHHESKSRKSCNEDMELVALNERHAATLSRARITQIGLNVHLHWHTNASTGTTSSWLEFPLRYRVADKVNDTMKSVLGPLHRKAKSILSSDQR
jgi:glycosyltransferase involved in cell wall biosynthesis